MTGGRIMMKKSFALITALSLGLLTACGSGATTPTTAVGNQGTTTAAGTVAEGKTEGTAETAEPKSDAKILYMVASGKMGDQAANDAIYSGIEKYCQETGAECTYFELAEAKDFDNTARTYCDKGYDLMISISNAAIDFLPEVARDYPEVKFGIIEGQVEGFDNVLNVRTDINNAGFLCGAFAVLMTEHLNGKKEVAFIGGVRNPDLDRSQFGFAAGAKYVGGNSTPIFIGNFTDAAKGKELTTQLFSGDVRIVQAWAGGANTGVFEAAQNMGEGYYAMGGVNGQFHVSDAIIASQVKNTDNIAYAICQDTFNGNWKGGTIVMGLNEEAVGIKYAPDGRDAVVPQEIKDQVEELRQKLIAGEITAPATEDEYNEFLKTIQ